MLTDRIYIDSVASCLGQHWRRYFRKNVHSWLSFDIIKWNVYFHIVYVLCINSWIMDFYLVRMSEIETFLFMSISSPIRVFETSSCGDNMYIWITIDRLWMEWCLLIILGIWTKVASVRVPCKLLYEEKY